DPILQQRSVRIGPTGGRSLVTDHGSLELGVPRGNARARGIPSSPCRRGATSAPSRSRGWPGTRYGCIGARFRPTMTGLDYRAFDADNHYYEALDAFTRHLDPRLGPRTVQWAEIGGRKYHVVGGRVSRAVVNPTFDPVAKPGAMHDYFRGNPEGRSPLEFLRDRERIRPEYRDRDARLAVLDEHGLEAVWLFPTLGVLYEELLKHDTEAVVATFRAFNRWLDEDWGVAYQGRIFAVPYLSLADVRFAVEELEWALGRGARVVCMRPAAVWTADGPRSPADPMFDPFWARVDEAGITVVAHAADSGYTSQGYARDGFSATFDDHF